MKTICFKVKHPKFDKLLYVTSINIQRKYLCVDYSESDVLKFISQNDLGTINFDDVEIYMMIDNKKTLVELC
jgi:hypothetical protein